MRRHRVAILGCRDRGRAAARAYAAHPRAEVVALCDLVPDLLSRLGEELHVRARFSDLDRMLEETRPDLVVIATGTEHHFELCRRVLAFGAHVDVEKPICTELAEADELLALAAAGGRRIAVHHQARVGGPMRAVRAAIRAGRIGEVQHVLGSCKGYYGGYGLMNIGTHLASYILALAGPCRAVLAAGSRRGEPLRPEHVLPAAGGFGLVAGERLTALLELDGGVTGTLLFHRLPRPDSLGYSVEVRGTEGRLFWRPDGAWRLPTPSWVPGGEHDCWERIAAAPESGPGGADGNELDYVGDLLSALDAEREPECSGEQGLRALEILLGTLEAAARGCRVSLPQADRTHPLRRWREEAGLGEPDPGPRPYGEWLAWADGSP